MFLAGWPLVSGLLRRPPHAPPILGSLPPFVLTEPGGHAFNGAELEGRAWLVGFLDTGCAACAERLGTGLERLQYRIRNVGAAAGILEIAIPAPNPVLNPDDELTRRHANPRQWRMASGADARRLLAEVGALSLARAPMLEAGAAVALVDAHGRVRAVEGVLAPEGIDALISKLTLILNTD
jgi:hypothetical protein